MGRRRNLRRIIRIKRSALLVTIFGVFYLLYWGTSPNSENLDEISTSAAASSTKVSDNDDREEEVQLDESTENVFDSIERALENETAEEPIKDPHFISISSSTICTGGRECKRGYLPFFIQTSSSMPNGDLLKSRNETQFCIGDMRTRFNRTAPKMVSVAVVDEANIRLISVTHFEISIDDQDFRDFLYRLQYYRVIFVTSSGNINEKLSEETLDLLSNHFAGFNDSLSSMIPFESFIFIGQKGLGGGRGIFRLSSYSEDVPLRLAGCLAIPLGHLDPATPLPQVRSVAPLSSRFSRSNFTNLDATCGQRPVCARNEIPVSVYSGKNKDDKPQICVDGKLIISIGVNDGGRGLNMVLINSTTRAISGIGHFDTYLEESSILEESLEEINDDELMIVLSFDEASQQLSPAARKMLADFGSAFVWKMKFRASWYFIGQRGIGGFTQFEELNLADKSGWSRPIDKALCVPLSLMTHPSSSENLSRRRNWSKRRFCEKYDGYEEFCEAGHLDDQIFPRARETASLVNREIFEVPILVVAGLSRNSLRQLLETLINQPGIDQCDVLVIYDSNYPECAELIELFSFRSKSLSSSGSYQVHLAKSIDLLWSEFPKARAAIIIEEELLLSNDFLSFMSQMLPILEKDDRLASISAWNINGFPHSSTSLKAAYRVEEFPGFAFMLKRSIYESFMKGRMDQCCFQRTWEGWRLVANRSFEYRFHSIIPDVSRVLRLHVDLSGEVDRNTEDYFHRKRTVSSGRPTRISNLSALSSESAYDQFLSTSIDTSTHFNSSTILASCSNSSRKSRASAEFWTSIFGDENSRLAIFDDEPILDVVQALRRCFGLFHRQYSQSGESILTDRGFYKGVLRFSGPRGRSIAIVRSDSPFYMHDGFV